MANVVDLTGLDNLLMRLERIGDPDATPLMRTWMNLISDGNRRGVLAGLDKDGKPMAPVTYRPTTPKPVKIGSKAADRWRNGASGRIRAGVFGGFGPMAAGLHNNLTSAEYRKLDGPPLAPRKQFSRVITNLTTDYERAAGGGAWTAYGVWIDVVSVKGVPFLPSHFRGSGRLPVRNLAGVRPDDMAKARRAAVRWMSDVIRTGG